MLPSSSMRELELVTVHTTTAIETTKPPRKRTFSPANHSSQRDHYRTSSYQPNVVQASVVLWHAKRDTTQSSNDTCFVVQPGSGYPGIFNPQRLRPLAVVDRLIVVLLRHVDAADGTDCRFQLSWSFNYKDEASWRIRILRHDGRTSFQVTSVIWSPLYVRKNRRELRNFPLPLAIEIHSVT